jgi:hypothetical protein
VVNDSPFVIETIRGGLKRSVGANTRKYTIIAAPAVAIMIPTKPKTIRFIPNQNNLTEALLACRRRYGSLYLAL